MKNYINNPHRYDRIARTTVEAFRGVDYACAITHYPREKEPIWTWIAVFICVCLLLSLGAYYA